MNRMQVVELFKFLKCIYPSFEVNAEKIDAWAAAMADMDYERVMVRVKEYVKENKFPPTVAEIAAYAPEPNTTLQQMEQWRKEAEKVPEHVKLHFKQKMEQLIREKAR